MGWTYENHSTRDDVVKRQMGPFGTVSGKEVKAVEHKRVGARDWFLYEVRDIDGNLVETTIQVTMWESGAHKEIGVESHPYAYDCPKAWLKRIKEPTPDQECYYDWYMKAQGKPVNRCENCRKIDCAGHAHELIVVSASGDWAPGVPKGMVGVVCCLGGRLNNGMYAGPEEYRLVTKESYEKRDGYFVVDPASAKWEREVQLPTKELVAA